MVSSSVICALVPGRYYIGDVVMAMCEPDEAIDRGDTGVHEAEDGSMYAFDMVRSDGDGTNVFYDNEGCPYTLLSGFLGVLPWEMCKYSSSPAVTQSNSGGRIIDASGPIIFCSRKGIFSVYVGSKTIVIDTRPCSSSKAPSPVTSDDDEFDHE